MPTSLSSKGRFPPEIDDPVLILNHEKAEEGVLVLGKIVDVIRNKYGTHVTIAIGLLEEEENHTTAIGLLEEEENYTTGDENLRRLDDLPEEPVDSRFNRAAFDTEFVYLIESRAENARDSLNEDEDWDHDGDPSQFSGWAVDWSALERETGEEHWR